MLFVRAPLAERGVVGVPAELVALASQVKYGSPDVALVHDLGPSADGVAGFHLAVRALRPTVLVLDGGGRDEDKLRIVHAARASGVAVVIGLRSGQRTEGASELRTTVDTDADVLIQEWDQASLLSGLDLWARGAGARSWQRQEAASAFDQRSDPKLLDYAAYRHFDSGAALFGPARGGAWPILCTDLRGDPVQASVITQALDEAALLGFGAVQLRPRRGHRPPHAQWWLHVLSGGIGLGIPWGLVADASDADSLVEPARAAGASALWSWTSGPSTTWTGRWLSHGDRRLPAGPYRALRGALRAAADRLLP